MSRSIGFEQHIRPGSKIVLAVSGGPDSVFLLIKLLEIDKELKLKLIVAHFNHGLRGKESENDAKFVRKLAEKYDLPFECVKSSVLKNSKSGVEEKGRQLRYKFFEKIRRKWKAEWVLTAHHRDDNIETVLFNLIRGTSFNGLKGIKTADFNRHLLRPLLQITKAEIIAYLKQKKIPHRIDKSNVDIIFSRNLLRKKIIPLFKKINDNFEETFAANLENFGEIADFMNTKCAEFMSNVYAKHTETKKRSAIMFPLDNFLELHPAMQKSLLVYLYKKIHGSTNKLTWKHLRQILNVLLQKKSEMKKEFGLRYFICITRDQKNAKIVTLKKSPKCLKWEHY